MTSADAQGDRRALVAELVIRLTDFCRALRTRGVLATPAESIDAVRALELVDLSDRTDVYLALRVLLATRREDLALFDALFEEWWTRVAGTGAADGKRARGRDAGGEVKQIAGMRSPPASPALMLSRWARSDERVADATPLPLAAPSAIEGSRTKDFAAFHADELAEIERLAARLAKRLNARRSRRWRPTSGGTAARLDLRRTVRLSLKTGGDPLDLARRERKLRRTKLVALCDVSGSMDLYSRFLLQLLYALQHAFSRVETFVFSTRLFRITNSLAHNDYRAALEELGREVPGWSGGTKIGESVAAFLADWPRLVDRRTVFIVLSDGWDTGEPQVLAEALEAIHRRAGRVVWLNPLLGSASYTPATRGMQAALPHIDVFAPAHNVESFEGLVRHLSL